MRNSVRAPNRAFKLEDRDATTAVRVAVRRARETLLVDVLRGFLAGDMVEPRLFTERNTRNGVDTRTDQWLRTATLKSPVTALQAILGIVGLVLIDR